MLLSAIKTMAEASSSSSLLGISIYFSTKAYWDGETKSCMPRERGWCLHIELDGQSPVPIGTIRGEISNLKTTGLILSFNKKTGVTAETFSKYFKNGKIFIDGEVTMPDDLTRKLGLAPSFVIPEGAYAYKESGETVTITLQK